RDNTRPKELGVRTKIPRTPPSVTLIPAPLSRSSSSLSFSHFLSPYSPKLSTTLPRSLILDFALILSFLLGLKEIWMQLDCG
ncbi:hypothetical protein SDJN02_09488, partial [Cucurbita argyrosperma subsp. argyrosperma]